MIASIGCWIHIVDQVKGWPPSLAFSLEKIFYCLFCLATIEIVIINPDLHTPPSRAPLTTTLRMLTCTQKAELAITRRYLKNTFNLKYIKMKKWAAVICCLDFAFFIMHIPNFSILHCTWNCRLHIWFLIPFYRLAEFIWNVFRRARVCLVVELIQ